MKLPRITIRSVASCCAALLLLICLGVYFEVKDAVRRQQGYVSHQPWGHGVARGLEHYLGMASL